MQEAWRAFSRAWAKTGNRIAAKIAMIAITTSSSIRVKPLRSRFMMDSSSRHQPQVAIDRIADDLVEVGPLGMSVREDEVVASLMRGTHPYQRRPLAVLLQAVPIVPEETVPPPVARTAVAPRQASLGGEQRGGRRLHGRQRHRRRRDGARPGVHEKVVARMPHVRGW